MKEKSYTVNLPQTSFPMKANSAVREIEIQNFWHENQIYEKNIAQRQNNEKYILHDGPPYLSSSKIHIGTALNKILKDIVTKYKAQRGFYSPYVPGYDSHGLPIENAVLKDVKGGRAALTPVELRVRCREFALSNLKGQETNFKRLGVWGDWDHPYITLDPKFEAAQIRVFGKMAVAGYLYKGLKSVSWCTTCETALAEAEVEYADHTSDAVYVKFEVDKDSKDHLPKSVANEEVSFVIWTTTPWTLPANLGIALHPDFDYLFLRTKKFGVVIVAKALCEAFLEACQIDDEEVKVVATTKGSDLEFIEAKHPFMDRASLVVLGEHVTADTGTGCVHTAPGHGPEDFELGMKYKLGVLSPVDTKGIFTAEAGKFAGMRYDKANQEIVEHLNQLGKLVKHSKLTHSYPHCWRCKKPLIFRATEQWFASVDGFRKKALEAIDTVNWIPNSGRNRIYSMVENRSDWCISRQRAWGVPIPVFYCLACKKPIMTQESVNKIADIFEKEGSDSWWEKAPEHFLGASFKCPHCNENKFEKEVDIMDVWFDSGCTHATVMDANPSLKGSPAELYLEGSDQHRGWFQSSLLTSVAINNRPPYKTVLTHGFVMDETGRKMSKSMGNVVEPDEVIKQYGADVLRLWVASVNYTDDVPIGRNMLAQLAEVYRKLRNTARYLLGNLFDFDPKHQKVPFAKLPAIEKYILHRLQEVVADVIEDFDQFQFFKYYQVLQNFCVVDLSSFYFDIAKDRLYTGYGEKRQAVQTVLYELLHTLVRLLVPVAPHLAEDIWQNMPEALKDRELSVLLTDFPTPNNEYVNDRDNEFWQQLLKVRYVANKALELARAERKIGSSLEAKLTLWLENKDLIGQIKDHSIDLPGFFITSQVETVAGTSNDSVKVGKLAEASEEGVNAAVFTADGNKCARCWKYSKFVGTDSKYNDLCDTCMEAVSVAV